LLSVEEAGGGEAAALEPGWLLLAAGAEGGGDAVAGGGQRPAGERLQARDTRHPPAGAAGAAAAHGREKRAEFPDRSGAGRRVEGGGPRPESGGCFRAPSEPDPRLERQYLRE